MRVISGKVRGLTLKTIEGDSTRPTRDMVREALFSILMREVPDCIFLDLFAGSGAIGIEALSRGASFVTFVDSNPQCVRTIKENVAKAKFTEFTNVFCADYRKAIGKLASNSFDLIFLDPPYFQEMGTDAIQRIAQKNLLKEDGILVLETDAKEEIPEEISKYIRFNYKRYGRNVLSFMRRKG